MKMQDDKTGHIEVSTKSALILEVPSEPDASNVIVRNQLNDKTIELCCSCSHKVKQHAQPETTHQQSLDEPVPAHQEDLTNGLANDLAHSQADNNELLTTNIANSTSNHNGLAAENNEAEDGEILEGFGGIVPEFRPDMTREERDKELENLMNASQEIANLFIDTPSIEEAQLQTENNEVDDGKLQQDDGHIQQQSEEVVNETIQNEPAQDSLENQTQNEGESLDQIGNETQKEPSMTDEAVQQTQNNLVQQQQEVQADDETADQPFEQVVNETQNEPSMETVEAVQQSQDNLVQQQEDVQAGDGAQAVSGNQSPPLSPKSPDELSCSGPVDFSVSQLDVAAEEVAGEEQQSSQEVNEDPPTPIQQDFDDPPIAEEPMQEEEVQQKDTQENPESADGEQQVAENSREAADREAMRRFGIPTGIEVRIKNVDFAKLIQKQQNKGKGRKSRRNAEEMDSAEEDELMMRSAKRLLSGENSKMKPRKKRDESSQDDGSMERMSSSERPASQSTSRSAAGPSTSKANNNSKKAAKRTTAKKTLVRKTRSQTRKESAAAEKSDDDEEGWLSKDTAAAKKRRSKEEESPDNKSEEEEESSEDESDTASSAVPARKMTRAQYQRDKEIKKLMKAAARIDDMSTEEDDEDRATMNTEEDDEGRDMKNVKKVAAGRQISQRTTILSSDTDEDSVHCSEDGFEVLALEPSSSSSSKRLTVTRKRITAKKTGTPVSRKPKRKEKAEKEKTPAPAPKPKKRKRLVYSEDEAEENELQMEVEEELAAAAALEKRKEEEAKSGSPKKVPKKKKKLALETKEAERAEKERRKRLEERQKEFNGIEVVTHENNVEFRYTGEDKVPELKSITLDPDKNSAEPLPVSVHPSLVRVLKKHQAEGIRFMYNTTIEDVSMLDQDGGGAILGHCMGLGKTLQVIAFLHTIMTHPKISKTINRVLVVVPKNVILNWEAEFKKWLFENDPETDAIEYTKLDSELFKTNKDRLAAVKRWMDCERPAVLIIGYEMYRNLTLIDEDMEHLPKPKRKGNKPPPEKKKKIMKKSEKELEKLKPKFREYLHEGPHMVICDEGHKLRNTGTNLFCTMRHIKTKRRICLTGTPLQNKLEDMVDFVKPSLLGNLEEFKIRFATVINRGRSKDADAFDVLRMKKRCHILFQKLEGILDRRDYTILKNSLPPKQEYVIYVRLTKAQIDLYRKYLEFIGQRGITCGGHYDQFGHWQKNTMIIQDHHVFHRIWTHPYLLVEHERKEELQRRRKELDNFIDDEDEEGEEEDTPEEVSDADELAPTPSTSKNSVAKRTRKRSRQERAESNEGGPEPVTSDELIRESVSPPAEVKEWAKNFVSEDDFNRFELSYKLTLLEEIIKKCEQIGDKLLVFSQFLNSIALIERMLTYRSASDEWFVDGHEALAAGDQKWAWKKGLDYEIIDGSVSGTNRDRIQKNFNDPLNLRTRLLLISTKAGSLGTNLIGANRVVIFDCSWNPSNDTQSLFRVYRFGQVKPVYIYRLVAQGTMEERIYNRQVTKESIAKRVTTSAQIQRHYTNDQLESMYKFEPAALPEKDATDEQRPRLDPPKDRLLGDIILKGTDAIVEYHAHDLLFDEIEDEKLSEDQRAEAWNEYEQERAGRAPPPPPNQLLPPQLQLPPPMQPPTEMEMALAMQQMQQETAAALNNLPNLLAQHQAGTSVPAPTLTTAAQLVQQVKQFLSPQQNNLAQAELQRRASVFQQQQLHLRQPYHQVQLGQPTTSTPKSPIQQQQKTPVVVGSPLAAAQAKLGQALAQAAAATPKTPSTPVQQKTTVASPMASAATGSPMAAAATPKTPVAAEMRTTAAATIQPTAAVVPQPQQQQNQQQSKVVSLAKEQNAKFESHMAFLMKNSSDDKVYNRCLQIPGMTSSIAMQIFQIKQFLCHFVYSIPPWKLGAINSSDAFTDFIMKIIEQSIEDKTPPDEVFEKVRDVHQCVVGINYITRMFPEAREDIVT